MAPDSHNPIQTLAEIRSLMERSSRFISLSGLSGVCAGIFALAGAAAAFAYLGFVPFEGGNVIERGLVGPYKWGLAPRVFFALNAGLVLAAALTAGIYFTTRNAKAKGQRIFDPLTYRLLVNLAIPLGTGALFCGALLRYGLAPLVAPTTLIFYGLALLNGSKYTFNDIRYLGLSEIGLGLVGLFFPGYGLELWAIGFGVLHIAYGAVMYNRYEKRAA